MPVLTLSINGTDLSTTGRIVEKYTNLIGGRALRGDPFTVPYRAGAVHVPQTPDTYTMSVALTLIGDTPAEWLDGVRGLAELVWSPAAPLILTRTIDYPLGPESTTCEASYVRGLDPETLGLSAGRVVLEFLNLTGGWLNGADELVTL